MGFAVRLPADTVAVDAGANSPITVEIRNDGPTDDRFELEIEGLDAEWTSIPVPVLNVRAGETVSEKVFVRPTRASESLAGNYPFVIRARSLESGEHGTAQGVVSINPYHHISAEISPKKGNVGPFHRTESFGLTLVNLGNVEHSLQLFGSDPDEALAFEFSQDQVTLAPGQQKDLTLSVSPTSTPFVSSSRLHGFLVSARSTTDPAVGGSTQAQLEERAFLSPATLIFLLIAAVVMGFWYTNRPIPPGIEMSVSREQATVGENIEIWWRASNATSVTIQAGGKVVASGPRDTGTVTVKADQEGDFVITAVANRGDKQSELEQATIRIGLPPVAPMPEISEFSVSTQTPKVGQSVIVSYKFGGEVTRAFLQPVGELNLNMDQIQVPITDASKRVLTLIAENRDGKTAKKAITLTPKEESLATVIVFKASPERVPYPGGLVKITWHLSGAVRAELTPNPTSPDDPVVNPQQGTMDTYVDRDTEFTLTAFDDKGRSTVKKFKVAVEAPPALGPEESARPSGPRVLGARA